MKTFCARNFKSTVPTHPCTGGPRCKGACKADYRNDPRYLAIVAKIEMAEAAHLVATDALCVVWANDDFDYEAERIEAGRTGDVLHGARNALSAYMRALRS